MIVETRFFWALAFAVTLAAVGCESTPEPSTESEATLASTGPDPDFVGCQAACGTSEAFDETDVVAQPGADVGDLVRCPVSGAVFRVTEERPLVEHEGRSYYVCCGGCAGRFAEEPARFAVPSS